MPRYIANQNNNFEVFYRELAEIKAKLRALAGLQTIYVTYGNSYYVLDSSGDAVAILGDIDKAPMGVGTGTQTSVSTGLTGRGIASYKTGSWVQL